MTLLTEDQITEIADTLEALGEDLGTRDMAEMAPAVMAAAAGSLVSVAAMRAPVPQSEYFDPPPYPYGPEAYGQPAQSVPLQVTVTGSTRQELEDRARREGEQVFGGDASLAVTLTGSIVPTGHRRGGEPQYTCGALVRQNRSQGEATEPEPGRGYYDSGSPLG